MTVCCVWLCNSVSYLIPPSLTQLPLSHMGASTALHVCVCVYVCVCVRAYIQANMRVGDSRVYLSRCSRAGRGSLVVLDRSLRPQIVLMIALLVNQRVLLLLLCTAAACHGHFCYPVQTRACRAERERGKVTQTEMHPLVTHQDVMILTRGLPSPLLVILGYRGRFQSGCRLIAAILLRPLSFPLYRSTLSLPQHCNAMKLSGFTRQTSAFLCDSGVWVALGQWDCLPWAMHHLLLKARQATGWTMS